MLSFPIVAVHQFNESTSKITGGRFGVVADIQRTSFFECAIGREVNDDETEKLLSDIADSGVDFVVMTGDMIYNGADEEHWHWFDYLMERSGLAEGGKSVLPVLGNHEYWGNDGKGLNNLRERFQNNK